MAPIFINLSITATQKLERLHDGVVKKATASGCCGGCPMGNLAQELSDTHPEFRMRLAKYFEECVEAIAGVLKDGINAGEFRKNVDPKGAAYLLLGSMQGLTLLSKSMKKVDPLDQGFWEALKLLKGT
jgi:TetR/AcrR family transcriptional regulator, transcriptional repressor for nem operon